MQWAVDPDEIDAGQIIDLALQGLLGVQLYFKGNKQWESLPLTNVVVRDDKVLDAADITWGGRTGSIDRIELFTYINNARIALAFEDLPTYTVTAGSFNIVWPGTGIIDFGDIEMRQLEMSQVVM